MALEAEESLIQLSWSPAGASRPSGRKPDVIYRQAVREALQKRGEPAAYLPLYTACLTAQAAEKSLPGEINAVQVDLLSRVQAQLSTIFSDHSTLIHFPGPSKSGESGQWWLKGNPETEAPLSDRIEMEIVRYLQKNPGCRFTALYDHLCAQYPGLLTPSIELAQAVLTSYAEIDPDRPDNWMLRPQEQPAARRADLDSARELLFKIAADLRLKAVGDAPILWQNAQGEVLYAFYLLASSLVSRYVLNPQPDLPAGRSVVVIPGGRAGLLSYKLKHDPRLEQAFQGWRILKFRHLRRLSEWADLTLGTWNDLLDADPLGWDEATQLSIL
jgi:hypothetical protein